jgi:hypothetical protein
MVGEDARRPAGQPGCYRLLWMTCRPQESGQQAALVRRWHEKTNYWRKLARQSSPSLVSGRQVLTSRLFVMQFDWDYLAIVCSLAVLGAAFILFLAM